jgi:hypothetical protein
MQADGRDHALGGQASFFIVASMIRYSPDAITNRRRWGWR